VVEVVSKHEGGYDTVSDDDVTHQNLRYGIGSWDIKSGGLARLLAAYSQRPGAQNAALTRGLLVNGAVQPSAELAGELKTLGADPVMQQAQKEQFRTDYIVPALPRGKELGLQLPLSIAILCDLAVNVGWGQAKKITDSAAAKLHGNPAQGVDEKQWDLAVLDARVEFYQHLVDINPNLATFLPAWLSRVDSFRELAKNGAWNLTPEEVEPRLAGTP
jgi:Glycosyl hydrolase family 46